MAAPWDKQKTFFPHQSTHRHARQWRPAWRKDLRPRWFARTQPEFLQRAQGVTLGVHADHQRDVRQHVVNLAQKREGRLCWFGQHCKRQFCRFTHTLTKPQWQNKPHWQSLGEKPPSLQQGTKPAFGTTLATPWRGIQGKGNQTQLGQGKVKLDAQGVRAVGGDHRGNKPASWLPIEASRPIPRRFISPGGGRWCSWDQGVQTPCSSSLGSHSKGFHVAPELNLLPGGAQGRNNGRWSDSTGEGIGLGTTPQQPTKDQQLIRREIT